MLGVKANHDLIAKPLFCLASKLILPSVMNNPG
jgi:hypothetical protein